MLSSKHQVGKFGTLACQTLRSSFSKSARNFCLHLLASAMMSGRHK